MIFGFLLQKGRAAKYQVILGQLLLKDWTVLKIMLTAIAVGAIGVHGLVDLEITGLHIKPMMRGGVMVGGIFFGVGLAIFGYCPGTGVAACGEGKNDAVVGVIGMLAGAWVFVWMYPLLVPLIRDYGDWGNITLPETTGIPAWGWILLIGLVTVGVNVALPHSRPTIQEKSAKTVLH
ncbi:MAG: YeeE/YedE family protein [Nitrospira sp.]|nr:YeeE/YedE family protein [Nitrospira sp.]